MHDTVASCTTQAAEKGAIKVSCYVGTPRLAQWTDNCKSAECLARGLDALKTVSVLGVAVKSHLAGVKHHLNLPSLQASCADWHIQQIQVHLG